MSALAAMWLFQPSDEELIRQALEESVAAGREGRPGGVLEYLSESFQINTQEPVRRSDIARVVRLNRPNVTLGPWKSRIAGDLAVVQTSADVELGGVDSGGGAFDALKLPKMQFRLDSVTIRLRRETDRRWLIVPVKKWRVISVSAPGFDPYSLAGP
jgi:hypothetical protein